MTIATGVAKTLAYKKETTWGTAAGASGAQYLRRVTSDLSLNKEGYQSEEIRTDYQISDFRHGVRRVEGTINGELSPGTYEDLFAAALRKSFAAGATTGAVATIAVTGTGTQFTRSSGSFLTDGFKIGDVISATGFTDANNNSYGRLDPVSGRMEFASAGHPSPLVRRAGGAVEEPARGSRPLGLGERCEPDRGEIFLAPGDLLLISTDGLFEALDGR